MSLAGWVVAFLCAQWLARRRWPRGCRSAIRRRRWRYAAGFVLVFMAVAFSGGLVAALVRKLVAAVGLRPVDRTLGAAFGLVRGAVALLAVAVGVHFFALSDSAWWHESRSAIVLRCGLAGPETRFAR